MPRGVWDSAVLSRVVEYVIGLEESASSGLRGLAPSADVSDTALGQLHDVRDLWAPELARAHRVSIMIHRTKRSVSVICDFRSQVHSHDSTAATADPDLVWVKHENTLFY